MNSNYRVLNPNEDYALTGYYVLDNRYYADSAHTKPPFYWIDDNGKFFFQNHDGDNQYRSFYGWENDDAWFMITESDAKSWTGDSNCSALYGYVQKQYWKTECNLYYNVKQKKTFDEVIYDFPYEDGWTNCFAGERASGLTAMPSLGAIYGSKVDTITGTGIRRDEYGDYCCAMGVWYGYCGDRFLIELENGTQFTTKICDSKGYADDGEGKYHNFGGSGKCIVEFIYDDYNLPSCVAFSGSWGYYNWNGLDLGANIKSIKKINYGEPVEY